MFSVRRLVMIFAVLLVGLPLTANATALNGMKIIFQIDAAKQVYDQAVAGCAEITNSTLALECLEYRDDLVGTISDWEVKFSEGTLTVAYDASVEVALYDYETDLNNVAAAAGYVWTSADDVAPSSLAIASDDLAQPDAIVSGCVACFGTVTTLTVKCASAAPGLWKLACFAGGLLGVYICANSQVCPEPVGCPTMCGKGA
jgi:hypothetical protein